MQPAQVYALTGNPVYGAEKYLYQIFNIFHKLFHSFTYQTCSADVNVDLIGRVGNPGKPRNRKDKC